MDIYESYLDLNRLAAKASTGGLNKPEDWTQWADKAQREFVSKYYGNVMAENKSKGFPLYGFEATQRVRSNLRPFITRVTLVPDPTTGQVQLPPDYWQPWGFFCKYAKTVVSVSESLDCGVGGKKTSTVNLLDKPVKLLDSDEYGYRLDSSVQPPTLDHPICKFEGNTAFFAPFNVNMPVLTYIRRPKPTVFNFTLDANGEPVYNPTGSVGWEAPEDCHNELVNFAMEYLGIRTSSDNVTAYARYKEQTGS